jgi:hypothetical protein
MRTLTPVILAVVTLALNACGAATSDQTVTMMSSGSSPTVVRQFSTEAQTQLASSVLMHPERAAALTRDAVMKSPGEAADLVAAAVSVAPERISVITAAAIDVVPHQAEAIRRAARDARDGKSPGVQEVRPR